MTEHVAAAGFGVTQSNIADQVDQFTQCVGSRFCRA
ncbi:hypothetical protein SAMN05216333_106116 [Nitrosomonas oligotropha]|uniref:Uncharacterized protein n=1 Tax=Nitrosomonas oligotropha TaxID=42354 RepID=A0A1H8N207_9PROT|nr:hypothetical protein SAMN05216333_106116 [Nitrosomonas oligotropha]